MLTLIYAWHCSHEGESAENGLFALAMICDVLIATVLVVVLVEV
jgi:hypothetical protein